ncbi:MAG: aspartoacylase [Elainella sp. Prado103]|jgi:aspartoacylase|nr:aspartoacylase [Elainella sp. Prado103]
MPLLPSDSVKQVAIVGGTHGNEWTGIYLVKKFEQFPHLIQRSTVNSLPLLANPRAILMNRRYIDRDLNRCFAAEDLTNPDLTGYENQRAKAISTQLLSEQSPPIDLIIDLHSTTANMGLSILVSGEHPFNLKLSAYLSQMYPAVRVCRGIQWGEVSPTLRSLVPLGFAIEVGAIAQGMLDAALFQQTEQLIYTILDYLEAWNQNARPTIPEQLTLFQAITAVDYPRDATGELQAMIHPDLQFQDYQPLRLGDPMFLTFSGETITYNGSATVFPIFINEAAYYEKGIAMILTEKQQIPID